MDDENLFEDNNIETDQHLEQIIGGKIHIKSQDTKDLHKMEQGGLLQGQGEDPYSHLRSLVSEEELVDKYHDFFDLNLKGLSDEDEAEKKKMIDQFAQSEFAVNKIESGPVLEHKEVYQNLDQQIEEFQQITKDARSVFDLNLDKLRRLVKALVEQTGPNQNSSLLLLNLISPDYHDYFASHSLNVCIFSLIIAIESSKLMMQKVKTPEISRDFFKSRLCSNKTFNEKEIEEIGLTALLHDIYVKIKFPELKVTSNFTFRDQLEYKRHSIESYRMIQKLNLNAEIERGVLHHHERLDGTGYPDGLNERVISRYGKVISLADHYERLAFLNPFQSALGPIGAINHLLKKDKTAYDGDFLICFLKATSLFPLGSFVELNTGEIAMVVEIDKAAMQKPKVKILFSKNNRQVKNTVILDLNEYAQVKISRAVHPREIKSAFPEIHKQLDLV